VANSAAQRQRRTGASLSLAMTVVVARNDA
jgi:hypothetical protein